MEGRAPDAESGGHRTRNRDPEVRDPFRGHDSADIVGASALKSLDSNRYVIGRDHRMPIDSNDHLARCGRDSRIETGRSATRRIVNNDDPIARALQFVGDGTGAILRRPDGDHDVDGSGVFLRQDPVH